MAENISKSEIRFWISIITLLVTFTVAFTSLRKDVEAIVDREIANKQTFLNTCKVVQETHDIVIRIEEKQQQMFERLQKLEN